MQFVPVYRLRWLSFVASVVLCLSLTTSLQAQTPTPPVPPERLDVTGDDLVTPSDVNRIITAWNESQQEGQCMVAAFATRDVNGDGCIDVVDAQLAAAQLGTQSGPDAPLLGLAAQAAASPATFVVDSSANDPDADRNDDQCRTSSGKCTLRAAIEQANRRPGHETINFNIRNGDGSCPSLVTIYPGGLNVPTYVYGTEDLAIESWFILDDPNNYGVTIDGYSQCGARPNDQDVDGNAVIKIELKGRRQYYGHGMIVASANNVVRGLSLYNWDRQLILDSSSGMHNQIEGNLIGTNAAQKFKDNSLGTHHTEGIRMRQGASYNIFGCGSFTDDNQFVPCTDRAAINAARNIVAGNGNDGVHLQGRVFHNRIVGNYIGLKQDGETCNFRPDKGDDWVINPKYCGNGADGVDFELGPQYNWLGGETPAERNVISGNGSEGIEISHGRETQFNRIVGNYFGLDATGSKAVRNINNGISYEDTVNKNVSYNNVVSGNGGNGLRFYNSATLNEFRNNLVGFAADGVTPLPNGVLYPRLEPKDQKGDNGVMAMGGSHHNLIIGNIIANHPGHGIWFTNDPTSGTENRSGMKTAYNTISQNSIFNNGKRGIAWSGTSSGSPNRGLAAPVLSDATSRAVSGTACANCTVEVFIADKSSVGGADDAGEGQTFIGSGMSDGAGAFTVQTSDTALGVILTATATDTDGNTSQFSKNIAVTLDIGATETVVAGTAQAQASATALIVQATADAAATTVAATAQAGATQTTIVLQTAPALAATSTTQAGQTATAQAGQTATAIAIATDPALAQTATALAQAPDRYTVSLPLITR